MPSHRVLDTGVLMVAEGLSEQASGPCIVACSDALLSIKNGAGSLVLDNSGLILAEYLDCGLIGKQRRGPGAEFLLWILTNQWNPDFCSRATLPVRADGQFANFPNDRSLKLFDQDDRKFVCTALAHPAHPRISVSVDTDWANAEADLARNGVFIEKLCPADLDRLVAGKKIRRRARSR